MTSKPSVSNKLHALTVYDQQVEAAEKLALVAGQVTAQTSSDVMVIVQSADIVDWSQPIDLLLKSFDGAMEKRGYTVRDRFLRRR